MDFFLLYVVVRVNDKNVHEIGKDTHIVIQGCSLKILKDVFQPLPK